MLNTKSETVFHSWEKVMCSAQKNFLVITKF